MRAGPLSGSLIAHVAFIAIAAYIIWVARELPAGGDMMPVFAACGVIVFSLYNIAKEVIERRRGSDSNDSRLAEPGGGRWLRVVLVFAITVAYVFLVFRLGYFVSTLLFLGSSAASLGVRRWRTIALTAIILLPLMYGFFVLGLGVNLPRGILI